MTTPISLKSTRLEILLEVTEDRGIESRDREWKMGSRTTDHSPFCGEGRCRSQEEENGGMRIEEVFLSYALGVSKRSVRSEGMKGGERVKATQRVPRIWREEYESIHIQIPHPDPEGKDACWYQVSKSS